MMLNGFKITIILSVLFSGHAFAKMNPKLDFSGWINAEYSNSDNKELKKHGNDYTGIQQVGLVLKATHGKFQGVLATDAKTFSGAGNADKDATFKVATLSYDDRKKNNFKVTVGSIAIMYGLKADGFAGDRSVNSGLEFGGGVNNTLGAVSNQAYQGIKFDYFYEKFEFNIGLFDSDESAHPANNRGSSLTDNYYVQAKFKDLFKKGLYGSVGHESKYIAAKDKSGKVFSVGIGYNMENNFDVSLESINLNKDFISSADDENLLILELTKTLNDKWEAYLDLAQAKETELMTTRLGVNYALNHFSTLTGEIAQDKDSKNDEEANTFSAKWQLRF